jgi:hypothetical protein
VEAAAKSERSDVFDPLEKISLVKFNAKLVQQREILLFEGMFPVMFFLALNVFHDTVQQRASACSLPQEKTIYQNLHYISLLWSEGSYGVPISINIGLLSEPQRKSLTFRCAVPGAMPVMKKLVVSLEI